MDSQYILGQALCPSVTLASVRRVPVILGLCSYAARTCAGCCWMSPAWCQLSFLQSSSVAQHRQREALVRTSSAQNNPSGLLEALIFYCSAIGGSSDLSSRRHFLNNHPGHHQGPHSKVFSCCGGEHGTVFSVFGSSLSRCGVMIRVIAVFCWSVETEIFQGMLIFSFMVLQQKHPAV